jgi:hypothetical protein
MQLVIIKAYKEFPDLDAEEFKFRMEERLKKEGQKELETAWSGSGTYIRRRKGKIENVKKRGRSKMNKAIITTIDEDSKKKKKMNKAIITTIDEEFAKARKLGAKDVKPRKRGMTSKERWEKRYPKSKKAKKEKLFSSIYRQGEIISKVR